MEKKTFRPKKGREGVRVSISLSDRQEDFVASSWPHSTEDAGERDALSRHPWITDRPEPKQSQSAGESSTGKEK